MKLVGRQALQHSCSASPNLSTHTSTNTRIQIRKYKYKYTNTNTKMQIQIQRLLHHVPRFVYTHIRAKNTASLENNCSMTAMMILMIIDNDGEYFVDLSIFWWLWWWQWYAEEDGVEASQPLAPTKLFRIFLNFSFLTFLKSACF